MGMNHHQPTIISLKKNKKDQVTPKTKFQERRALGETMAWWMKIGILLLFASTNQHPSIMGFDTVRLYM